MELIVLLAIVYLFYVVLKKPGKKIVIPKLTIPLAENDVTTESKDYLYKSVRKDKGISHMVALYDMEDGNASRATGTFLCSGKDMTEDFVLVDHAECRNCEKMLKRFSS